MAKTVLIVEDDADLRALYALWFEKMGLQLILASNGFEGAEMALRQPVDFIVLDVMMPDATGIEVLSLLSQNPTTKEIPVLVVSNLDRDQIRFEGYEDQVMDVLLKANFTPRKVAEMVSKYLS